MWTCFRRPYRQTFRARLGLVYDRGIVLLILVLFAPKLGVYLNQVPRRLFVNRVCVWPALFARLVQAPKLLDVLVVMRTKLWTEGKVFA